MEKQDRILIIDDNEHVRDITKSILNHSDDSSEKVDMLEKSLFDEEGDQQSALPDFRIDEASQGADAIKMVKQAAEETANDNEQKQDNNDFCKHGQTVWLPYVDQLVYQRG